MSQCMTCKEQGKKVVYLGESSNSLTEHASQHLKDAYDPTNESHMMGHIVDEHPGEAPENIFSIKQPFLDS